MNCTFFHINELAVLNSVKNERFSQLPGPQFDPEHRPLFCGFLYVLQVWVSYRFLGFHSPSENIAVGTLVIKFALKCEGCPVKNWHPVKGGLSNLCDPDQDKLFAYHR